IRDFHVTGVQTCALPICYDKLNARKVEWEWLLDRKFAKDTAFHALNDAIGEQIQTIGKPHFKHKLVVGIPSPILDQQDWGTLNRSEERRVGKERGAAAAT